MPCEPGRIYRRLECPECKRMVAMPQFRPHLARQHGWSYVECDDLLKTLGKYETPMVKPL